MHREQVNIVLPQNLHMTLPPPQRLACWCLLPCTCNPRVQLGKGRHVMIESRLQVPPRHGSKSHTFASQVAAVMMVSVMLHNHEVLLSPPQLPAAFPTL